VPPAATATASRAVRRLDTAGIQGPVEVRREIVPASAFRLPQMTGMDRLLRRRGDVLERLLHHEGEPVVVRAAQPAPDRVLIGARARTCTSAEHGIERMRFALGVDEDLRPFLKRFARDPVLGRSLLRRPWLRSRRRPEPFEALVFAICEQLIEYERAAAIQRRIVSALGRRAAGWNDTAAALSDMPSPEVLAGTAPARLRSFDLAASRAMTMIRCAREVARGRIDLHDPDHERGWRRLRAIPGIGAWTVEILALQGQGRHDQVPAGDLGLLKAVGRRLGGGDPRAIAEEHEVRAFFAPYEEWAGLASVHLMGA
jgi:DNA-3-methyladenine glycosylase II